MVYKKDAGGAEYVVTCAEPPPDVGETFAKALAARLNVDVPTAAGNVSVGGGFAEQVATAIAPLMVRTQGLQVLRDSAYALCIDYMNGWIPDSKTYLEIKDDRFNKAMDLIRAELLTLPGRVSTLTPPTLPGAVNPPAPAPKAAAAASAPGG